MQRQSPWIPAFAGMTIKGRSSSAHEQGPAMFDIMRLPETLGAAPNQLSAANYAHAVEALGLDDAARDALLARDANEVNRAVGGRAETRCFVFVPD